MRKWNQEKPAHRPAPDYSARDDRDPPRRSWGSNFDDSIEADLRRRFSLGAITREQFDAGMAAIGKGK